MAAPAGCVHDRPGVRVFRVARIASARPLAESFERPADFELAAFWRQWSAEFEASRPRFPVTLRASPRALAILGEVFGQAAGSALAAALPPDEHGWRVLTLPSSTSGRRRPPGRLRRPGGGPAPPSVRAGLCHGPSSWGATMRQNADRRGYDRRIASRWSGNSPAELGPRLRGVRPAGRTGVRRRHPAGARRQRGRGGVAGPGDDLEVRRARRADGWGQGGRARGSVGSPGQGCG